MHHRPRPLALLGVTLLLVPAIAAAQDGSPSPSPALTATPTTAASPTAPSAAPSTPLADGTPAIDEAQLAELEALVPPALAGLPLGDNLVLATGEQLATVMSEEEASILGEVLAAHGATFADYAAATTYLELSGDDVVIIQAHRFKGVPATEVIEAWVELLTRDMAEPEVVDGFIAGRAVTLISDAAEPDVPLLHLFPADDVTWMMVAADRALVESFLRSLEAEGEA